MAWFAPVVAWVGANAGAITAVAGAATAGASVYSSMKQADALKQQTKLQQQQAKLATSETPKVVPLADENSGAVRLRMLQTQRSAKARQGAASTLVSGALGDSRAPALAAPLVLGKAA